MIDHQVVGHISLVEIQHVGHRKVSLQLLIHGKLPTKRDIRDWILVFHDYWSDIAEYPIHDRRALSVGFPHFDEEIEKCDTAARKPDILLISRPSLGRNLFRKAVELSRIENLDDDTVCKLHSQKCKG